MRKIIFLGLDGQNPEFVERYLEHLPNFRRMIEGGSWGPLLSTFPCDTPTNWTALATGARASKSRITGFAFHEPGTRLRSRTFGPEAFARFRSAEFLWEAAADQGRKTILINYPFGWHSRPSDNVLIVGGDTISGGIPEIMDCGCFCTPDRSAEVEDAKECRLEPALPGGGHEGTLLFQSRFRFEWTATGVQRVPADSTAGDPAGDDSLRLTVRTGTEGLRVFSSEGGELCSLKKGEWSDYFSVPFGSGTAWLRLFLSDLRAGGGSLLLFHSPVTWGEGWTKPAKYAPVLVEKAGPYQQAVETKGNLFTKGWFGDYALEANVRLLADCGELFSEYAKVLTSEVKDWSFLFIQLHSTDGMNHKRLCHIDPDCPLSNAAKAKETDRWFLELYKETDRILGRIAALAEAEGAAVVVTSDHSAVPTHTWVDTARPFIERGMLSFDDGGVWDPARSTINKKINHSIYINLKGREPDGIVNPSDYESLRDEVIGILLAMRDPRTGECPVAVAARREDLDGIGANGENFGDIVYLMRPGYTNQPASELELLTVAKLGAFVSEPEKGLREGYCFHESIQGNHHDYLPNASYPGVCTNRGVALFHGPGIAKGVRIVNAGTIDIAPTMCEYVGIHRPADCEGKIIPGVVERE